jgi:hypothetical protein
MSIFGLTLEEAIQVRTAEVWLDVGQPLQALHSLTELPDSVWACPWPREVLLKVNNTLTETAATTQLESSHQAAA